MGELPQSNKFDRFLSKAPIIIGILIFLAQAFTQFSMFFQLPEKVRVVLARLDTIEDYAKDAVATGTTQHAAKEEQIKALHHLIEQREVAHKLMVEDDRTQWEAIRELDRRIDELSKGTQ